MQSCDSKYSEPLSPHSVCRHLLLLYCGIPAPGPLSVLPWDLQPFTLELVALPGLVSSLGKGLTRL
jgi:hypothetical protein